MNVLTVPAERREELERRFAGRAGLVESAEGFEGFQLLRPDEGFDRYLVVTQWRSEEDFQRWTESQAFKHGHAQAAAEAKPQEGQGDGQAPGQGHGHGHGHGGPAAAGAELWSFEVIQSAEPKA